MSACPTNSSNTELSSRLSGMCPLCRLSSCLPPRTLCFWEVPHTYAQEGDPLASHTAVVQDTLDKGLDQDMDLQDPLPLQGSLGRLDWADPCSLGIPAEDIPELGSLVVVGPGLDSLERWGRLGMEEAAQNSSLS